MLKEFDTQKELSELMCVPLAVLQRLNTNLMMVIGNHIYTSKLGDEDSISLDIGIGQLNILVMGDSVKYKFIPSTKLEKTIKDVIVSNVDPLEKCAEEELSERILALYKGLLK